MKLRRIIALILTIIFLSACSGEKPERNAYNDSEELQFIMPEEGEQVAVITTDYGNIYMRLFEEEAPMATANFAKLVAEGYYNNLPFGYIEEDFIVQAGNAQGAATTFNIQPFGTEISDNLHHYTGAVGMSKTSSDENANSGIFYIVQTPKDSVSNNEAHDMTSEGMREEVAQAYRQVGGAPYLDNNYTVFAHIYDGMDVVDEIAKTKVDENGTPQTAVLIKSVQIIEYELPIEE